MQTYRIRTIEGAGCMKLCFDIEAHIHFIPQVI